MQSLLNNKGNAVMPATTELGYSYMMFSVKRDDDVSMTFSAFNASEVEIGFAWLCPFVPPFVDELGAVCKTKIAIKVDKKGKMDLTIHAGDGNHFIGKNYLVVHDNDINNFDIVVTPRLNRHIQLG